MLLDNQFVSGQELATLHLRALLAGTNQQNVQAAGQFAETGVGTVVRQIEGGSCQVAESPKDANLLIEPQTVTESQRRLEENRRRIQEKQATNLLLYGNNKNNDAPKELLQNYGVLSATQHLKFVLEMKQQNIKRKNNRLKQQQAHTSKQTIVENQQRQLSQLQRMRQIQKRKEAIKESLRKMRQNHQHFVESEQQSRKIFNEMKRKKRLYQKLKQDYEDSSAQLFSEEEHRRMKERKDKYKLDIEQINMHQQEYLQWKKKQLQSVSRSSPGRSSPPNYQPPPHSEKMQDLLREEARLSNKVELNRKIAAQKLHRIADYTAIVRQNYKPKSPPASKTVTTERHKSSNSDSVERRSQRNRTQLGNEYLKQARLKANKRSKTEERYANPEKADTVIVNIQRGKEKEEEKDRAKAKQVQKKQRISSLNYIPEKQRKEFIERMKREEIEKILRGQHVSQAQRLRRLKLADERLSRELRKKEAEMRVRYTTDVSENTFELLLGTIRAKLNLINSYREQQ